jgi:hypothetical protein
MANTRFAVGMQSEYCRTLTLKRQTNLKHRTNTVAWIPPCSYAADSNCHNTTMYVHSSTPSAHSSHPILTQSAALLLAGCSSSSPLIPGIFLISIYYSSYTQTYDPAMVDPAVYSGPIKNIVGHTLGEVRVGYFGICWTTDGGSFLCSNNATSLMGGVGPDQDPLNLVWVAQTFKDAVVFPYLL